MREADASIADKTERANRLAFIYVTALTYFAAPVTYVGVVQAALCAELGANSMVANLPATLFIMGGIAPLLVSARIAPRLELTTAATSMICCAGLLGIMAIILLAPIANPVKIGFVIACSTLTGVLSLIQQTYVMQCLRRGTSLMGRARALKVAFTVGPLAAVAGSLLAQFLLGSSRGGTSHHAPFATLYAIGVPCLTLSAVLISRMRLEEAIEQAKRPLMKYLGQTIHDVLRYRPLLLICAIAAFHNLGMSVMPNLALYAGERTGRSSEHLVGLMMAIRFGSKSLAGGIFGTIAERRGTPAALIALDVFLLAAVVIGSVATGYPYLAVFAFMGGAELAGVYDPNYCLSVSRPENGARNVSVLMIVSSLASVGGVINGALGDHVGFRASFLFAGLCAVISLLLILRLPAEDSVKEPALRSRSSDGKTNESFSGVIEES